MRVAMLEIESVPPHSASMDFLTTTQLCSWLFQIISVILANRVVWLLINPAQCNSESKNKLSINNGWKMNYNGTILIDLLSYQRL